MQPSPQVGFPDPLVSFPRGKKKGSSSLGPWQRSQQYLETDALQLFPFFSFLVPHRGTWKFPGSCRPTPQPQQRQIQASSESYQILNPLTRARH